ncbi:MAG: class I SAM-dependent methyltransferase [Thermodesulfobacteriota bacterium]
MSGFDETRWSERGFSKDFRNSADEFILERATLIRTAVSYYEFYIKDGLNKRILDLGCGDGIITNELILSDSNIEAVLIDASVDMISAARERLKGNKKIEFIESSLEGLLDGEKVTGEFDFVVSSLAIHHLEMADKRSLFNYIFGLLRHGGAFVNIDVVLGPTDTLDDWYLDMWSEWLGLRGVGAIGDEDTTFIKPKRCKDIPGNKPDTLAVQIEALKSAGFKEVDCFYKFGAFAVFGGKKG